MMCWILFIAVDFTSSTRYHETAFCSRCCMQQGKEKNLQNGRFLSMDEVTMKVMLSCSCKMADITDEGISCKHCFSDIYIACSCCNDKTIKNLIINSSNRMFCPSVQ